MTTADIPVVVVDPLGTITFDQISLPVATLTATPQRLRLRAGARGSAADQDHGGVVWAEGRGLQNLGLVRVLGGPFLGARHGRIGD